MPLNENLKLHLLEVFGKLLKHLEQILIFGLFQKHSNHSNILPFTLLANRRFL